jgi:hypothetical protein
MRFAIAAAIAAAGLYAAEVRCPARIELAPPALTSTPPGWKPRIEPLTHDLISVTVYDGPVEEKASLVPDGARKSAVRSVTFWTLDPANSRGYWLQCHYAATALTLIRAVDRGSATCQLTSNPGLRREGLPAAESALCR